MEKNQKIKYQLSLLDKINASDNDILELKITTEVEEMLEASRKNISLNAKVVWGTVYFNLKISFLEFKKLLSKKPFSELNYDDLSNYDLEFKSKGVARYEEYSINGESDLDDIVKALKGTSYEYKPNPAEFKKDYIDRVAEHIWENADQSNDDDFEYKFQSITSLETENYPFFINEHYWRILRARGSSSSGISSSESIALLEEFLDWEKDEGEQIKAYEQMGRKYLWLKAYDKAIESLNTAIKLGGENYNTYSDLGESYFELKNYDEAINAFRKASEFRKDLVFPEVMLARSFKEKEQNKEALEHINIAIGLYRLSKVAYPYMLQLYSVRGDINSNLNNLHDAIEDFKQESSLNNPRKHAYSAWRLGQLFSQTKNYEESYNYFQKAGQYYFEHKNYDEAINAYRKASELNKSGVEDYLTYSNLGQSHFELKNYDEAINAFKKASELDKDAFYPDYMVARIFKEKKQNKEALEHINIAINRDSLAEVSKAADYQMYGVKGDINIELGNFHDALEDFKQESSLSPNNFYPVYRLGLIFYQTKNYEEGYHHLQKAQSLNERMKSDGLIWYLRGHCLYILKEYGKAYKELEKASSLGNKDAQYYMTKIKEMKDVDIIDN